MKTDKTICLNSKVGGVQPSLQDRIYDVEGCSTAITTSFLPNIAEPFIVAMRGREPQVLTPKRTEFGKAIRKKYESHEIEMSRHYMQKLEPRTDGISNTLTSVQKDNILAIPEATAKGYAEAHEGDSVNLAVPNSKTRRGRVGKQMVNTLDTGCQQGVVVAEPSEDWQTVVGNKQLNPFRGSVEGTSPCITSACGAGGGMTPMLTDTDLETTKTKEFIEQVRGHEEIRYRIRKLTPRECFRLMGVDDADIDKIQLYPFGTDIEHPAYSYEERLANMSEDEKRKLMRQGISNSQQYKLAGNSIVVDVLYHLFRKMFCETACEKENFQQTLF